MQVLYEFFFPFILLNVLRTFVKNQSVKMFIMLSLTSPTLLFVSYSITLKVCVRVCVSLVLKFYIASNPEVIVKIFSSLESYGF